MCARVPAGVKSDYSIMILLSSLAATLSTNNVQRKLF